MKLIKLNKIVKSGIYEQVYVNPAFIVTMHSLGGCYEDGAILVLVSSSAPISVVESCEEIISLIEAV